MSPAPTVKDRLSGLLTLEFIAGLIALASPLTPARTGGASWSPAELVTPDPSYPEKVVAAFITVNVMVLLIGGVAWIVMRIRRRLR